MPSLFTYDEYVDMILIYGECQKNGRRSQNLYRERYPNRETPSFRTFQKVEAKLRSGFFPSGKQQTPRRNTVQTEENIIHILAYIQVYPHVSTRFLAQELDIGKSTVQRVLRNHTYHPYKIHLVQGLKPQDPEKRLNFIAEISLKLEEDNFFLDKICWSDESRFHNNGTVNRHNCHYWSPVNPHWMRETAFQEVWGINVWCALFNGHLIGPYFYQGTLTGERYLNFLQNDFPLLLQNIPIAERATMWLQQDGAPPHFSQQVTNYINLIFPRRWIGRNGVILWPARSPDITPLDFFLWGFLKELVYTTQPRDLQDLQNKITAACRTVTPIMIKAACNRNLRKRFEYCISEGGGQFEHILKKRAD